VVRIVMASEWIIGMCDEMWRRWGRREPGWNWSSGWAYIHIWTTEVGLSGVMPRSSKEIDVRLLPRACLSRWWL
jgi:hypothetical protein